MRAKQYQKNIVITVLASILLTSMFVSLISYIYASDSTIHVKFNESFSFQDFTVYNIFDQQNTTYAFSSSNQIQNNIITLVKSVNIAISKNETFSLGEIKLSELLSSMNVATILDTKSFYILQFRLNKYTYQVAGSEIIFKLPRGLRISYISLTLLSDLTFTIKNLSMGHSTNFYYICDIPLDYYSNYFIINSLYFNDSAYIEYVKVFMNYINQSSYDTFLNNTYYVNSINEIGNIWYLDVTHYQMLNLNDLLRSEYNI